MLPDLIGVRSTGTSFPSQQTLVISTHTDFAALRVLRFPILLSRRENANQIALPRH
jgi:hypothetical protein